MSDNPYAPPPEPSQSADWQVPVPRETPGGRSSVPMVFGVLAIVFAGLVLIYMLGIMIVALISVASLGRGAPVLLGVMIPWALFTAMTVWLLVVGIGLVRYRDRAMLSARRWGITALLIDTLLLGLALIGGGRKPHAEQLVVMAVFALFLLPFPLLMASFFSPRRRARYAGLR